MTIRELITTWGFEIDEKPLRKLEGSMSNLKNQAAGLASAFALTGGGLVATIFGFTKSASEAGDEINNTSERIGIGTASLQEYRYAAYQSDIATEAFDNSLRKLSISMAGASEDGEGTSETFAKLGVKTKDSAGNMKSVEQVLNDVADGLSRVPNQADRVALAQKLMGRESGRMVNLLQKGSGALNDLRAEARATGSVMDKEAIAKSVAFQDTWKNFVTMIKGLRNEIGTELLPIVGEILKNVKGWIQANRVMIRQGLANFIKSLTNTARHLWNIFMNIAEIVGWASKAFGGFGNVVKLLIGGFLAFKAIGTAIALVGVVKQGIAAAKAFTILGNAGAIASLKIAAIVLGIILLGLAIEDVVAFFQGKDSFFGDFIDRFGDWFKDMPLWGKAIAGFIVAFNPFLQMLIVLRDLIRFFQGKESVLGDIFNKAKQFGTAVKGQAGALIDKAQSLNPFNNTPSASPVGAPVSQENNIHIEQTIQGGDPQKVKDATAAALQEYSDQAKRSLDGGGK